MASPQSPEDAPAPIAVPPAGARPPAGRDEVYFEGTARHSADLGGYLFWIFICVVGGLAGWALLQIEALAGLPLYLLSLVGLPFLFWTYLRHITTRFKITGRRVETEVGVLGKKVESLELWRVLDVRYERSLGDRLLGNAKITLLGTDQTTPVLVLYGLPRHRELFERLRDAVQTARMTSRPMELVPGHEATELVGGGPEGLGS